MRIIQSTNPDGFTLLELLVAITVFAIMSFMAYGGLSYVIANSEASEKALQRLHEVQLAMLNVERDLSQVAQRSIRDEFGDKKKYIESGGNIEYLIELTRNGRRNPAKLLRSHLVRVAYKLNDGNLIRLHWPHLDRVQGMIPYETTLLTKVASAEVRFLDSDKEWHAQWPPLNTTSPVTNKPITLKAINFKISLNDWGEISRLFKAND